MSSLSNAVESLPRQGDVDMAAVMDRPTLAACHPHMRLYKAVCWNGLGYVVTSTMLLTISTGPWHHSLMRLAVVTATLTALYYVFDMPWDLLRRDGRLSWPLATVRSGTWRAIVTAAMLLLAMLEGAGGASGGLWAVCHAAVFTVLEALHNRLWETFARNRTLQPAPVPVTVRPGHTRA